MAKYPWFGPEGVRRLCRAYGTNIDRILGGANRLEDLGEHFARDLYETELRYLMEHELARDAEDALWRRSKLGLHLEKAAQERVAAWFETANAAA
jgi:glycerol-3-phosphate dehydrogenase